MINKFHYQMYPSGLLTNKVDSGERGISALFNYYQLPSNIESITKGTFIGSPYTKELILKSLLSHNMNVIQSGSLSDVVSKELDEFIDLRAENLEDITDLSVEKFIGRAWGRIIPSSANIQHTLLDALRITSFLKKNPGFQEKLYPGLNLGVRDLNYNHKIIDHLSFGIMMRTQVSIDTQSTLAMTGVTMEELTVQIFKAVSKSNPRLSTISNCLASVDVQANTRSIMDVINKRKQPSDVSDNGLSVVDNMITAELETMWTNMSSNSEIYGDLIYETIIYSIYRMMTAMSIMASYDMNTFMSISDKHHESVLPSKYNAFTLNGTHVRDTIKSFNLYVNSIVEMVELALVSNPASFNYDRVRNDIITVTEGSITEDNKFEFNIEALNTIVRACYLGSNYIVRQTGDFIESFMNFVTDNYSDTNIVYTEIGNDIYSVDKATVIDINPEKEKINERSLLFGLSSFMTRIDVTNYEGKYPFGTFRTFSHISPEVVVLVDIISMMDSKTYMETLPKYTNLEVNDTTLEFYKELSNLVKILFEGYLDNNNRDYDFFTLHDNMVEAIGNYTDFFNRDEKHKYREVIELKLAEYSDSFDPLADVGMLESTVVEDHPTQISGALAHYIKHMGVDLDNIHKVPYTDPHTLATTYEDESKDKNSGGFRNMFGKK